MQCKRGCKRISIDLRKIPNYDVRKTNVKGKSMKTYGFEKLDVYLDARKFVGDIYRLSNQFPDSERFALSDQIHRAAVSITSNL